VTLTEILGVRKRGRNEMGNGRKLQADTLTAQHSTLNSLLMALNSFSLQYGLIFDVKIDFYFFSIITVVSDSNNSRKFHKKPLKIKEQTKKCF
jgi:hypothetical protein